MRNELNPLKRTLALLFLLLAWSVVVAQQRTTVTGTITDTQGNSLQGVNVVVKGTTQGTASDTNGFFSIDINQSEATLEFSYIGYLPEEIIVAAGGNYNVALAEDIQMLDEMIVIGYGAVRKMDLTGSISTVRGDELAKRNVSDVSQALQGLLGGVHVSSNSGAPGSEASVLVRGISTINNNNPLYVVDDIPLTDISWLNPKDIESIQVLKDASASAIFGSRASNGVIIIQTTKAKEGKTSIVVDITNSVQQTAKVPQLADAIEYAQIANQAALNAGNAAPFADPLALGAGTNWWNEVTQAAITQNYSININKGTEDLKIATGLSYFNQEGIVKGGEYERLTLKLNTELKITDRITIGENLNIGKDNRTNGPNLVWDVLRVEPTIPVYLPENEQEGLNEYSIFHPSNRTDVPNPMGRLARNFDQTEYLRIIGNLFIRIDLGLGFSFESKFAFYQSTWENNWFRPDYYIEPTDRIDINSVGRRHNNRTNYNWNNLLNFTKNVSGHDINATAGFSAESFEHRTLYGSASNMPGNNLHFRYLDAATTSHWTEGVNDRNTQASLFSRINYSYDHRYLLSASFRADGSSRFSKENRWGYFPAVSGAWNIHEESFMGDIFWLSQLKVRSGWGQVGNQDINNDGLLTTLGTSIYVFGVNQEIDLGMAPESVGNAGLKWETVEDLNIGLDFGILNQSLTLSFDYFERKSKGMLMRMSIPAYLGAAFSTPWANVGSLNTKGFEFVASYRKSFSKDFSFSGNINFSRATSIMEKMAYGEDIRAGNHQRLDMLTRTAEGQPAGAFYGWVTDGIFQNISEVENYTDAEGNMIQPNAQPGDFRFVDLIEDGRIDGNDREVIGNPEPKLSFGLFYNLRYKALDLSMIFNGTYGNDVLNAIKPYTHVGNGVYNSYKGLIDDAWSGDGSTNTQPRLTTRDSNQNFRYSDYYIEDGSYLRLRSAQIGYNIPDKLTSRARISNARIYIGGENLFTLTKFTGLDPDIGGSALQRGIDWGQYPLPKVFMIGANFNF